MYDVEKEDDFIFCFHEKQPETLVMLKPLKQLTQQLNAQQKRYLVWVGDFNPSQQLAKCIKQECKQQIIIICNVTKLQFFLAQTINKRQTYFLIISQNLLDQVRTILSTRDYVNVCFCICYPSQNISESRIVHVNSQEKLLEIIKKQFKNSVFQNNLQLNFVGIDNEIDSLMLRNIICTMLYQKVNVKQLGNHLQALIKQMQSWWPNFKSKQAYQTEYFVLISFIKWISNQNKKDSNQIFRWYTRQFFIYKIINRILRFCRHSHEIYYIQPLVKQLYNAIKRHYQKNKIKSKYNPDYKNFVCYRGMLISDKQLKFLQRNVGSIVQNLSFLSTTKQRSIAICFTTNALITIEVKDEQRDQSLDYGYAHIQYFSQHVGEKEVLFNPLNSFRIKQIIQKDQYYQITLEYGPLAKIINKMDEASVEKEQTLIQKRQKNIALKQYMFSKAASIQGECFFTFGTYQHGSLTYWKKYIQIARLNKDKAKGYKNLSQVYHQLGLNQKSLECCFQWQKYAIKAYGKQSYMNAFALNGIGLALKQCKKIFQAQNYFCGSIAILKGINGLQSYYYFQAELNLAQIYISNGEFKIAKQKIMNCCSNKTQWLFLTQDMYSSFLRILAKCSLGMGNRETALQHFQFCYQMDKFVLNSKCPTLIPVLKTLANIYMTNKQYQKCLQKLNLCKDIILIHYGIESIDICYIVISIADLHYQINQKCKAEEKYFEVFNLLNQKLQKLMQKKVNTQQQFKIMASRAKQYRLLISQCYFKLACIYGKLYQKQSQQFLQQYRQIIDNTFKMQAEEIQNHLLKKKQTGINIPQNINQVCVEDLKNKINYNQFNQKIKINKNIDILYLQQLVRQLKNINNRKDSSNLSQRQKKLKLQLQQVNYINF